MTPGRALITVAFIAGCGQTTSDTDGGASSEGTSSAASSGGATSASGGSGSSVTAGGSGGMASSGGTSRGGSAGFAGSGMGQGGSAAIGASSGGGAGMAGQAGAPDADGPLGCHEIDNTAPLATHRVDPNPFSFVAEGGEIAPGFYHLREFVYYGGDSQGCETLSVYNTWQYVPTSESTGYVHVNVGATLDARITGSMSYAIMDTLLALTPVCGSFGAKQYAFTASDDELIYHDPSYCQGTALFVWERQ